VARSRELRICIVGAGMSGIAMGIALRRAGIESFEIYEKADKVGGTWRENRYPGLTCDVPSHFYSYSFEPNPAWSHRFSPGPEIQQYFEGVAEKYGVLPHCRFRNEVRSAHYRDGRWQIETSDRRLEADVLISAWGALHQKKYPQIDGLEKFAGACFHSADWDDEFPLAGKRIGVIGTGSSAVQMMEPLSKVASHLTMFQRTAQWIMPVGNVAYTDDQLERAKKIPFLVRLVRLYYQRSFEAFSSAVVKQGRLRKAMADRCRAHLETVRDPVLRAKLTPDYEAGCKRLIMSRTFYPTLQKPHVHLETAKIDHVEPRGVVTADGRLHELDVLVLATGFDAHAWGVDDVVGEQGQSLKEAWSSGTRSYFSVGLPGFPNFFMLVGPNSPIGNISLIDISERQTAYILRLVELLRRGKAVSIAPSRSATEAFHARLLEAMKDTVWVTGCNSWYLDEDGVPITWPWSARRFHRDMRRPRLADWDLRSA
jgi:cation diffusion facilitator CzcD-associated flavoprotein CzcO